MNPKNQITKQDLIDLRIDKSKPIRIVKTFSQVDEIGPAKRRRQAVRFLKNRSL